jgi:hypothetical protein
MAFLWNNEAAALSSITGVMRLKTSPTGTQPTQTKRKMRFSHFDFDFFLAHIAHLFKSYTPFAAGMTTAWQRQYYYLI